MPIAQWWMTYFLFFCLFAGKALGTCSTGSAKECGAAHFVPGASLAGSGYDVVTLRTKGAFVINVNAWHNQNGSCTLCQNQLLSNVRQRLPLALTDWQVQPCCKRSLKSRAYLSDSELLQSVSSAISEGWKADLQLRPRPGTSAKLMVAGSKSRLTDFATQRAKVDRSSFTSHEFHCQYYRYRVKDQPLLATQFSQALATLPKVWNDNTKYHYRKLVATYGTHYVKSVALGGHFKDVTAIRTCEVASHGYTIEEVKDCLAMEASAQVGINVSASAMYQRCKELRRSMKTHSSFHQAFSDRETEVTGGNGHRGADLFFSEGGAAFTRWADSLPTIPGMVRYALEPLHHLLPRSDPRHANLRRYISEYIMANALSQDCGGTQCPSGSYRNRRKTCSCLCREDSRVDRQCCPKVKGMGHLTVMVKQGFDLWGDYLSGTDGYVIVRYSQEKLTTSVISNNNNPTWNTKLDLGDVQAGSGQKLAIEVWDSDTIVRDDHLGTCKVDLRSGQHDKVCYLKYGKVTYSYTLTCGPHLGGPTCQGYAPRPDGPAFTLYLAPANFTLHPNSSAPSPSEEPIPSVMFP